MKRKLLVAGSVLGATLLALTIFGSIAPAEVGPLDLKTPVSFSRQIRGVLAAKCTTCHSSSAEPSWYAKLPGLRELRQDQIERAQQRIDMLKDLGPDGRQISA